MSAGSRIVVVRFTDDEIIAMKKEIEKHNAGGLHDLYNISDFVRKGVRDLIKHRERSRRRNLRPYIKVS